jgi:GNAT superfamily N-acetyltransferase
VLVRRGSADAPEWLALAARHAARADVLEWLVPNTAVSTRRKNAPLVRSAAPADYPAIRDVVIAAYGQYADIVLSGMFSSYLADLLDLEGHASRGRLFVAEADEKLCGYAAFYPDASLQGLGWPSGWASGRALAVHPAARGQGVARADRNRRALRARRRGAGIRLSHGQLHDRRRCFV